MFRLLAGFGWGTLKNGQSAALVRLMLSIAKPRYPDFSIKRRHRHRRDRWRNADRETVVESYTITNMTHGTPLGTAENGKRYGIQGAFLIEAGISSSYHIAKFFGLTKRLRKPQKVTKPA